MLEVLEEQIHAESVLEVGDGQILSVEAQVGKQV